LNSLNGFVLFNVSKSLFWSFLSLPNFWGNQPSCHTPSLNLHFSIS